MRSFRILLFVVVFLLYGRTLFFGFVLDDLRLVRLMADYADGARESLHLYEFLDGDIENRNARTAGWYPWWLGDDVRYRHWRPIAERVLYAQYQVFGQSPFSYRFVSLLFYATGTCLVLSLFRLFGEERVARRGALAFAVMAGHAIPVVFVSAQSDVLALVLATGAMLAGARFVAHRRWVYLVIAVACFAVSLGVKEACLATAVLPLLFPLLPGNRNTWQRAILVSGSLIFVGMAWLALYVDGGYGSNTRIMLDPVHATGVYLQALPGRALVLLASMLIPVNPFLFYLRPRGWMWLIGFGIIGAIALLGLVVAIWRYGGRNRSTSLALLWMLPFLPLLVCTVPDDRIMMLPGIGFAYLVGVLLSGHISARVRQLAFGWFIVVHALTAMCVTQFMRIIETQAETAYRDVIRSFDRPLQSGDCAFFLNSTLDSQVLFTQLCFESVSHRRDVFASFLSDAEDAVVHRVDERTLQIRAAEGSLFEGFLGDMAVSQARPKREGDRFDAGEIVGRITKAYDGLVFEVEIEFRKPLDHESYRFFKCGTLGQPEPVSVRDFPRLQ